MKAGEVGAGLLGFFFKLLAGFVEHFKAKRLLKHFNLLGSVQWFHLQHTTLYSHTSVLLGFHLCYLGDLVYVMKSESSLGGKAFTGVESRMRGRGTEGFVPMHLLFRRAEAAWHQLFSTLWSLTVLSLVTTSFKGTAVGVLHHGLAMLQCFYPRELAEHLPIHHSCNRTTNTNKPAKTTKFKSNGNKTHSLCL